MRRWQREPAWVLFAAYAVLQAALGWRLGIQQLSDTPRFLYLAQHLWNPAAWQPGDVWYWAYAALIRLTGGPEVLWPIIAVQIGCGGVALVLLVQTASRLGGSKAGWVAGLLFLAYLDHQAFHWKVLTDSLFTSLSTIIILLAANRLPCRWWWLVALPLVLIRPVGWVVVSTLALVAAAQTTWQWKRLAVALGGLVGLLVAGVVFQDYAISRNWLSGDTIQGYAPTALIPPVSLHAQPGLLGWLHVWVQAPLYSLQLSAGRLFWFVAGVRPYFSLGHNLWLVVLLVAAYGLAFVGMRRIARPLRLLLLLYMGLMAASVVAAGADWDGRFLHPLVPVLCLLAGQALAKPIGGVSGVAPKAP